MRLFGTVFVAAAVAWAVLLIAAPFLASRAHASQASSLLILGVYGIGSLVCHQRPERSYHLWTAQMPVCARCAGIYAGAVVGVLAARGVSAFARAQRARASARLGAAPEAQRRQPRVGRSPERLALRRSALALQSPRVLLAVAVAPTMATLVYEWTTGAMPSHAIRAAAGASIGVAVAWLVVAAADNRVN